MGPLCSGLGTGKPRPLLSGGRVLCLGLANKTQAARKQSLLEGDLKSQRPVAERGQAGRAPPSPGPWDLAGRAPLGRSFYL